MLKQLSLLRLITYAFMTCFLLFPVCAHASSPKNDDTFSSITKILEWKTGFLDSAYILQSGNFLSNAGDSPYDDYALSLSRLGTDCGYDSYLSLLYNETSSLYAKQGNDINKSAEDWQKTALTILSLGGDPAAITNMITETTKINLLADYAYNKSHSYDPNEADAKALAYTLLTIDALDYQIPSGSAYTRTSLVKLLLSCQRADGSFSSCDIPSDTAVTALVVQALAPFYNDETQYPDVSSAVSDSACVYDAVQSALGFLSSKQTKNGDIKNGETATLESTALTLSACASLGIPVTSDQLFIRNGNSLLSGLMRYQMSDGGFTELRSDSSHCISNDTASLLALNALISYYRYCHGQRDFYDMRPEFSEHSKKAIEQIEEQIDLLCADTSKEEIKKIYSAYQALLPSDRRYVANYHRLSKKMDALGLKKDGASYIAGFDRITSDTGTLYNIITCKELTVTKLFTDEDYERYCTLPDVLTVNDYNDVTLLYWKLANTDSKHFHLTKEPCLTYDHLLKSLKSKKSSIETIMAKIDSINLQIEEHFSSLEDATKEDKELIDKLVYQAACLNSADRQQITSYEDLLNTQKRLSTSYDVLFLSIHLVAAFGFVLLLLPLGTVFFRQSKKDCRTR